ncbi:hypothetical protein KQX54_006145 [Cotesia glomerata]|uniref:Uncharacterized protein n=1 Tax=Cotesia glomerata TaxID=32391 RepID=A0AAV7IFZ7_COTGL|nr:hypothetical protein KQX54_006145 [Cotesia glomerata]
MGSSRGDKEWSQKSKQEMQQVMHDADFSCLENYPNAGSVSTSYPEPKYNYRANDISPPKTSNPGWSFGSGSNGFDTDLRPADIDSEYSFDMIGSNNFQPPATRNTAWLPDFNMNNNQDLFPKNPYSGYSNDNNYNDNYSRGGLFSYNDDTADEAFHGGSSWLKISTRQMSRNRYFEFNSIVPCGGLGWLEISTCQVKSKSNAVFQTVQTVALAG